MKEGRYRRVKRVIGYSVAMLCLMMGCISMTGCKGSEVVNVIGEQEKRIEEQYAPANQGEKQKEEEQVIGGSVGVKEGKVLIEGIVVGRGNEIIDSTYKTVIDKGMASSKKPEVHIWTAFNSQTLGKVVLIDNNTIDGTRLFYELDGTRFYRVTGESLINKPAEEELQTYVAMKGLAKAIDGSK